MATAPGIDLVNTPAPLADAELATLQAAMADEDAAYKSGSIVWPEYYKEACQLAYNALPSLLVRLVAAEARPTLLPADIQPAILLAQAQVALRAACNTLDRLMPLCLKKMDGDELEGYWATYHQAGKVADSIKPVIEAAKAKDAELMATPTVK